MLLAYAATPGPMSVCESRKIDQGHNAAEFETLERAVLALLEQEGYELLNHEQPARKWVQRLINADAPMSLVIQQFGKAIAHEPNRTRQRRADDYTSLGFLLYEFWSMDGYSLPASIRQAWHALARKSA